jgi:outer membrane receptor protein involved in Fe transport
VSIAGGAPVAPRPRSAVAPAPAAVTAPAQAAAGAPMQTTTAPPQAADANQPAAKKEDFFEMSIEQLMNVEVASTAALTPVSTRMAPAAVTTITQEQIQAAAPRSLFELLDIYVPNLQWVRNSWEADNMGLRGIMTDRDDKYLLLVNGRVMNERTHYGVISERDLPMVQDIHHIDVVRGPGSALYGPGAVSMVINIVTQNAETFQGTDVTVRAGAIEEFATTEIRHGQKFKDGDGGVFLYAGVGDYHGANNSAAPFIMPHDLTGAGMSLPSDGTQEGEPLMHPKTPNDGESYRDLPPLKFYGQIDRGDWSVWARYTRGGKQFVWDPQTLVCENWQYGWGNNLPYEDSGYGYQQATLFVGKTTELGPQTTLDTSFSYDLFDYQRRTDGWDTWFNEAYREDKYLGRAIVSHEFNKQHRVAFGAEVLHGEYGYDPLGYPGGDAQTDQLGAPMPRWSSNLYSALGEYQWNINDQWTVFLGGRVDDHTYTNEMFSPRAALVFTPTERDTFKLMWSRSVRANYEEQLKLAATASSEPEKLDSIELRAERRQNQHLDLAGSVFVHYNLKLIGFDATTQQTIPVATQRDWGFEVEAAYHTDKTRLGISHGFTKLYAFNLEPGAWVNVSAMAWGYGDDLGRWANQITKINAQRKLDEQWTLDGSLRVYWGFPGCKDFTRYIHEAYAVGGVWPDSLAPDGWERTYRAAPYLNLGLQYEANKNLTCRLDGYYLLGIFNEDFNKRIYGGNNVCYRSHAPALAASLVYRF